MSDLIIVDNTTVWDLAHSDARMFVLQSRCMEDILSKESGVGDLFDDQAIVDGAKFAAFLDRLVAIHTQDRPPVQSLVGGYLGVALVLAQRANLTIPSLQGDAARYWTKTTEELAPAMPR